MSTAADPPHAARAFLSAAPELTEALAERLGALLEAGDVLALEGELGSGKTTFVRGLARGLGVEAPVSSPTFILMHTYAGRLPVYHLDAWMAERGDAFLAEGGAEWLTGDGVAVVEWAERVRAWLPPAHLLVRLAHARGGSPGDPGGGTRRIELSAVAPRGQAGESLARRLAALEAHTGLEEGAPGSAEAAGQPGASGPGGEPGNRRDG